MTVLNEMNPEWEYPREKVHIEKYVGKGAFCVVAKAFVDELGMVAVKIPKGETKQGINYAALLLVICWSYEHDQNAIELSQSNQQNPTRKIFWLSMNL